MLRSLKMATFALGVVVCFSSLVSAQVPYGAIVGRVLDPSGGVISQASVRAINLATNVVTAGRTNVDGNYEFRELIPGSYRVEAQASGFKVTDRQPIEVRVSQILTLNITLPIGSAAEHVTVTGAAPLLESSTASISTELNNQQVQNLPRLGDSVIFELQLSPGVVQTQAPTYFWTPNNLGGSGSFTVGGATTGYNLMTLDGNPIQSGNYSTISPFPEMIQEVSVQTNTVDASLGRFTGLVANMVTKSGTNQLHGDAVYNILTQKFIAEDYFTKHFINNPDTGPVTPQKIAQAWPPQNVARYRFDVGGPLYIPHVYDGHNRTFWSFGMDFMHFVVNATEFSTVPTAAERNGDFSALLALGPQYQLYDPATTVALPNGRFERQPFPGNIIPPSRINSVAAQLLGYWKLPNTTGTPDGLNNYIDPGADVEPLYQGIFRLDHAFNENNHFFGSATFLHQNATQYDPFQNQSTEFILHRRQKGVGLGDVIALRPNMVLEFHWNFLRYSQDLPSPSQGFDLSSLGWPASLVSQINPKEATLPGICMTDFNLAGGVNPPGCFGGGGDQFNAFTRQAISVQLGYTSGNHSLRFGFQTWLMQSSVINNGGNGVQCENPTFNFDSAWTGGPLDNSPPPTVGAGFAAYLLGLPTSGAIGVCPNSNASSKYYAGYVQDDWKVSRKLTINAGLRYELNTGVTEQQNRTVRGFDFTTPNPIQSVAAANYAQNPVPQLPVSSFSATGGLSFAGVNGVPRNLWNADRNNLSPRIGFAYLIGSSTVLRGSYGMFYQPLGVDREGVIQSGFSSLTSFVPSLDNGQTFIATLSDPFPNGFSQPVGAAGGLQTFLGQDLHFVSPQLHEPYTQRWTLGIQRMLPGKMVLDVSYVGSRSVGLFVNENLNTTPPQYLSTSSSRDQPTIDELSQQVANPFFGIPQFQDTALGGQTIALSQLLTPHPQFLDITSTDNSGRAFYNSLNVTVRKRFGNGWTLQSNYTYSKFMQATNKLNPTDLSPAYEISPNDRTHYLTLDATYELPLGKGKRWLGNGGWTDEVFGGWSVLGIYTAETGAPVSWGNVIFSGNVNDITLPASERTPAKWFNTDAGFNRDPNEQLEDNIRAFPLYLSQVRGKGVNVLSLSVFKAFSLTEKCRLKVYAQTVNATNDMPFAAPDTDPTSSLFGQVTGLNNGAIARNTTFGAKLSW